MINFKVVKMRVKEAGWIIFDSSSVGDSSRCTHEISSREPIYIYVIWCRGVAAGSSLDPKTPNEAQYLTVYYWPCEDAIRAAR